MPAIIAAARSPWALRHGALAGVRPEALLAAALSHLSATMQTSAQRPPVGVDRLLVACDEGVGAQDLNIARRVGLDLGWANVPALTLDGAGATGLSLLDMAARLPGRTVVASLDTTTMVPPGAGRVRDYGRPARAEPEVARLDNIAARLGHDRNALDSAASQFRQNTSPMQHPHIGGIRVGSRLINSDSPDDRVLDLVTPPLVEGGIQTSFHHAEYADGAAAVLVESNGDGGRPIHHHEVRATSEDEVDEALRAVVNQATRRGPTWLAAASVVEAAIAPLASDPRLRSPIASGSCPSGDGLRMLVDAFHLIPEACSIVRMGGLGQIVSVTLGR